MEVAVLESWTHPDSRPSLGGGLPQPGHPIPLKPGPAAGPPWPHQPLLVGPSSRPVLCIPCRAGGAAGDERGRTAMQGPSPCAAGRSSSRLLAHRCTPVQSQPVSLGRSRVPAPSSKLGRRGGQKQRAQRRVDLGDLAAPQRPASPSPAWVDAGVRTGLFTLHAWVCVPPCGWVGGGPRAGGQRPRGGCGARGEAAAGVPLRSWEVRWVRQRAPAPSAPGLPRAQPISRLVFHQHLVFCALDLRWAVASHAPSPPRDTSAVTSQAEGEPEPCRPGGCVLGSISTSRCTEQSGGLSSTDFSAPQSLGHGTALRHISASLLCSLRPG